MLKRSFGVRYAEPGEPVNAFSDELRAHRNGGAYEYGLGVFRQRQKPRKGLVYECAARDDGNIAGGENTWYTNSNPLFFYNMDGITGLKTGTSNRAGSCLISTIYANNKGQQQKIVCIVFGGEDRSEMLEKSALLLKYAKQYYGS